MKYWLVAIARPHLEQCLSVGKYGRDSKFLLRRVSKGDKIAFYVTGESKVIAMGEVVSDCYQDRSVIFKATEEMISEFGSTYGGVNYFEYRIDFTHHLVQPEVDFKPLIPRLDFIKNPLYPHASMRRGFTDITENDWHVLVDATTTKQ